MRDNQQFDVIESLQPSINKLPVANITNRDFARNNMSRKLVTFDSGFAVWALGEKAYMSSSREPLGFLDASEPSHM